MMKAQSIGFQSNENRRIKSEITIENIMNPFRTVIEETLREKYKE